MGLIHGGFMFDALEAWHIWLIAGCVIAVIELLVLNSYYLLAVAAGAVMVGIASAMVATSLSMQILIFALGTALAGGLLYFLRGEKSNHEVDDISHLVGERVVVVTRIAPRGRVIYKSVSWAAESDDVLEIDASARIVRVNGSTLYVEKNKEIN